MKCMLEMSMQAKFQRFLKSSWVLKLCLKIVQPYTKNWRYSHVRCYLNVQVNWPVVFFPLVKERESRSSLDLSATIFIHVGCSIRHPSIPLENCWKRWTYRRGVRIAEKTQNIELTKRDLSYMWIHRIYQIKTCFTCDDSYFSCYKILRKCFLFVEFKMFLRWG